MSVLPAQCRAARALIDMGQATLARRAVVRRDVLADFENGSRTLSPDNLAAIRAALEAAGVIFIDENGEGPGVRLRKKARAMRASKTAHHLMGDSTMFSLDGCCRGNIHRALGHTSFSSYIFMPLSLGHRLDLVTSPLVGFPFKRDERRPPYLHPGDRGRQAGERRLAVLGASDRSSWASIKPSATCARGLWRVNLLSRQVGIRDSSCGSWAYPDRGA
jgi:hypothetical protein